MCWKSFHVPIKIKAKTPVTCYKVLYKRGEIFKSPFRGYIYKPYQENPETFIDISTLNNFLYRVYEGYHSYLKLEDAYRFKRRMGAVIVKCIIPEGAEYYVNENDEIVSNKIIVTRE